MRFSPWWVFELHRCWTVTDVFSESRSQDFRQELAAAQPPEDGQGALPPHQQVRSQQAQNPNGV